MKDVHKTMNDIRARCEFYIDAFRRDYPKFSGAYPLGGLAISQQYIVLLLEALDSYSDIWRIPGNVSFENSLDKYSVETSKLISLQKSCFVAVISAMENCAKRFFYCNNTDMGVVTKKVYLFELVQRSRKAGWISVEDEKVWEFVKDRRNDMVHSNGESNVDLIFNFPGGYEWIMKEGHEPFITMRHIPALIDWSVNAYACWIRAALHSIH